MSLAESQEPEPLSWNAPQIDLSVVVPVFDEEACVETLWQRLHAVLEALDTNWEVLLVDDGSSDETPAILAALAAGHPAVRVITLPQNAGQTAAFDAGFRAARGAWIATLDADLQNPPEELPKLLAAANGTDLVDLVYGRRTHRVDSTVKRLGSRVGNAVRNLITGHRVHDTGCSLKVYRADALRRIPLFVGMHRFLPTLFAYHGFRIREVEVKHAARYGGASKYTNFGRALRGLIDCFAVRWMRRRSLGYTSRETDDESGRDHRP